MRGASGVIHMRLDKKNLALILAVCYLLIGFFFWSGFRTTGVHFLEELSTFLFITLLWPLVISLAFFQEAAFPAVIVLIIALALIIKRRYVLGASLALTIVVLFSSLFLPVTIKTQEELSTMHLGLPLQFFVQDQSQYEPPLPWRTHISSARENPTNILWSRFAVSFLIMFLAIFAIVQTITMAYRHQTKTRHSET